MDKKQVLRESHPELALEADGWDVALARRGFCKKEPGEPPI